MTASECAVCGHPGLRPNGHADWCERTAAWLAVANAKGAVPVSQWPAGVAPNGDRCGVAGCDRPYDGRGMCSMHYKRWWRAEGRMAS